MKWSTAPAELVTFKNGQQQNEQLSNCSAFDKDHKETIRFYQWEFSSLVNWSNYLRSTFNYGHSSNPIILFECRFYSQFSETKFENLLSVSSFFTSFPSIVAKCQSVQGLFDIWKQKVSKKAFDRLP